ncbi:MAG: TetR/AcrR family transcriptional regulator [Tannerella sp.]|jgi:AcrR family transcriptional regulator|nr:TetR/AcrR family transcriptional regulator [Tannerella sp.]
MPRTKEQYEKNRDEKRQLIKKAALSLFALKGYDATSIGDIANNAEISKGLMYHYFVSKEELLQVIWDELAGEFEQIIDPDHDGEITDRKAENFIDAVFEMFKNKREMWKLYYQLSFQPKVVEFLLKSYHNEKTQLWQNLMFGYFVKKLNLPAEFGFFSVLVFFKGLGMVTTYTESVFGNDFLDRYKAFCKQIIFKPQTVC